MNERITELMIQAGGFYLPPNAELNKPEHIFLEDEQVIKFAELIVRECCQKLEDDGMVEVAMEMKQHFGVK